MQRHDHGQHHLDYDRRHDGNDDRWHDWNYDKRNNTGQYVWRHDGDDHWTTTGATTGGTTGGTTTGITTGGTTIGPVAVAANEVEVTPPPTWVGYGAMTIWDLSTLPSLTKLSEVALPDGEDFYFEVNPLWPRSNLLVWAGAGRSQIAGVSTTGMPGTGTTTAGWGGGIIYYDPGWRNGRFVAFDVSNPEAPRFQSITDLKNDISGPFVSGGMIYTSHHALETIVVNNPPPTGGTTTTTGTTTGTSAGAKTGVTTGAPSGATTTGTASNVPTA